MIIETLSTFDLVTDAYLIVKFAQSSHVAWTAINLLTMTWPFFISQIPFTTYQLEKYKEKFMISKLNDDKPGRLRQLVWFLTLTPMLLVYLFILDIFFLTLSAIVTPTLFILTLLTCGKLSFNKIK